MASMLIILTTGATPGGDYYRFSCDREEAVALIQQLGRDGIVRIPVDRIPSEAHKEVWLCQSGVARVEITPAGTDVPGEAKLTEIGFRTASGERA